MELEDKSSIYLFWLSEYLARKWLVNIGPNAAMLLSFFAMGEECSKGLVDDFDYQSEPKDIASFIRFGAWKKPNAEWIKKFEGAYFYPPHSEQYENVLYSLSGRQDEIDKLAAYIATNEEEAVFVRMAGADLTEAETIVFACINGNIPEIMRKKFHDSAHAFTDRAITLSDNAGKSQRLGYSDLEVKDGVLQLHNVAINIAANLDDIIADITSLVCISRVDEAVRNGAMSGEYVSKCIQKGIEMECPGYGPCSGGKCQIGKRYSLGAKVLRTARVRGCAYDPRGDDARAMGLWLWDYARENACSVGGAIWALGEKDFFKQRYDVRTDQRTLHRWYTCTKKCIEKGEVLTMS